MADEYSKLISASLPSVTRREFLITNLVLGASALFSKADDGAQDPFNHIYRVIRDDDLLQLEFHFFRWRKRDGKLRALGTGDSLIAVRFPPQNLAEAIFEEKHALKDAFENDPLKIFKDAVDKNDPRPPVKCYLSGPSWLVFRASNGDELSLDVGRWLRLISRLDLKVAAGAVGPWIPRPPGQDETRLEIPYRLYISPEPDTEVSTTSWERSSRIPSSRFREMWHAALRSRRPVKPAPPPEGLEEDKVADELKPPRSSALHARALWSPDFMAASEPPYPLYYPAFRPLSLHALTRHRLVKQMAAGDGWIDAEHLILTALGADASLHYNSQKPIKKIIQEQIDAEENPGLPNPGTELRMWKHRIVIGRDVFFAEAFVGFLLPLNFHAVYVEITKRKFVSVAAAKKQMEDPEPVNHPPGAFLLKRRFTLVMGDQRHFGNSESGVGRAMPHKNVRVKMLQSPDLADPAEQMRPVNQNGFFDPKKPNDVLRGIFFFPKDAVTNADVHWPMEMFDESGKTSEPSRAWLFFASNIMVGHRIYRDANQISANQRTFLFPSQKVAMAPEVPRILVPVPPGIDETDHVEDLPLNALTAAEKFGEELEKNLVLLRDSISVSTLNIGAIARQIRNELSDASATYQQAKKSVIAELTKLKVNATEAEAQAKKGMDDILQPAHEALKKAQDWYSNTASAIGDARAHFMNAWGGIVTQFRRAKALGASLETKAMRFASGFVRDEFAAAQILVRELGKEADPAKLPDLVKELVKYLTGVGTITNPIPTLQTEVAKLEKNARERIGGLLANVLESWELTKDGVKETEVWLRQRVERFASDVTNAKADLEKAGSEFFHPIVEEVEAIVPAVKQLIPEIKSSAIQLFDHYVAGGIQSVRNGAYAKLNEVVGKAENIGQQIKNGVAQPAAIIAGISREVGAIVADGEAKFKELANKAENLTNSVKDTVEKFGQDITKSIPAGKILGVLDLKKVVGLIARGQMPDMNVFELPEKVQHVWEWTVAVKSYDFGILKFTVQEPPQNGTSKGSTFNLRILSTTTLHLPPPKEMARGARPWTEFTVDGYLGFWNDKTKEKTPRKEKGNHSFALNLLGLIEAQFTQMGFSSYSAHGEKPETSVKPELVNVEFLGPMNFVKKLQELLGMRGFNIDITPSYIFVGYELELPPITTGVFCMRAIRLLTSLELPFRTDPLRYRFGFSTFARPFELAVMGFAGRGFIGVEIASNGDRLLEGALEFGGALSFDIAIASGGLYVMAGIYFKISNTGTELSGYIRAGGFLNVLGLITASVEFMLMLRYRSVPNALWGICTITVSIDMGLWSWDVSVAMEKQLAGSSEGGGNRRLLARRAQALGQRQDPGDQEEVRKSDPIPFLARGNVAGHYSSPSHWRHDYLDKLDLSFVA